MSIEFYGYKKCGTCRKAEQVLKAMGVDYRYVDITVSPPDAGQLKSIAACADVAPRKLFNTSGQQYRELKIKERLASLGEAEIFTMLAGNGRLIRRPLVTDGSRATVGFRDADFRALWGA